MNTPFPPGFYPFWFWNDRLTRAEIRWQVAEMAQQGMRGFFIHSRQGLEQPYLSEAFFEMVKAAVEAAAEEGLVANLYDEYPYPSGIAGGEVVLGNPQFYATELISQVLNCPGGALRWALPPGKLLSVQAFSLRDPQDEAVWEEPLDLRRFAGVHLGEQSYRETGLTAYNQKRFFASAPSWVVETEMPEGRWRIYAFLQSEVTHHKYWGHFVDVLNPSAVQQFITLTHERYRQRLGSHFGKTIRAIFTDETAPGWSDCLPDEFLKAYDYDLLPLLPALREISHPRHCQVSFDFSRLVYRLFCQAYEEPIAAWCQQHGLAYTGEKPSLRLAQLKYMDIPGCEPGHTKAGAPLDLLQARIRQNTRATASAAYFYDKPGALDECYHSLGWSGTLQDARLMADGQLLNGITYLVIHGLFYSTHGLKKHDAPPTFFFQAPYWPFFGELSRRVEKISQYFNGLHIDAQVLLVEPASGLPEHADLAAWERIQSVLVDHQIEFLMADTDILQSGRIEGGKFMVKDLSNRAVVLPPVPLVEAPLYFWLEEFRQAGGLVIEPGRDFNPADFITQLFTKVSPSLALREESAEAGHSTAGVPGVQVVRRTGKNTTRWLVINTNPRAVDLHIDAGMPLRELPLEEGLPPSLHVEREHYRRKVHPFEGLMLEAANDSALPPLLPEVHLLLSGTAQVKLLHKNLLRLYRWRMSLLDDQGSPYQSAEVPAVPIANQLEGSGMRLAPKFKGYFGHAPELTLPEMRVRYEAHFFNEFAGAVELVMEPGSLVGDWQIWVNDQGALKSGQFQPTTAHVRGSLGADITGMLRQGENTLRVELTTDRHDGGLLNALYLAGDFGVETSPFQLVSRPAEGIFEEYTANRLPFYAGAVEYTLEVDIPTLPSTEQVALYFDTETPFNEACEISVNTSPWMAVLWQPRCRVIDSRHLTVGCNQVAVRVYTTLIRSFEGQWFDETHHRYGTIA
jgi:hypothetical protein